jgi:hypothetical protein
VTAIHPSTHPSGSVRSSPSPWRWMAFLGIGATLFLRCTTMNMPLHNFSFDRDINNQWVQVAAAGAAGMHFDTVRRSAGLNSGGGDLYYVNYVLPALGIGGRVSAYEPFRKLIPSYETGGDAWWTYYTYVIPASFIISARLLHVKYFTCGLNLYPFSWPFIVGSASLIGTVHLPGNIDLHADLHCNPTLMYALGGDAIYGFFNEWDVGVAHTIRVGRTGNKLFYSCALESYRGVNMPAYDFTASRPDLRLGVNVGLVFGTRMRRFGVIRAEKGWPFTWPQPGYRDSL